MAICNLFRALSKKTGNVMMFSQYSEDLTQCFTQHDNYDVIPSRFVALNIDYSKLDGTRLGAKPRTDNLNVDLPTYLQNYFENGCAWLMGNQVGEVWFPTNWTPDVHSNLFWNFMVESGLISPSSVDVEGDQGETTTIDTFKEVKYVGNIDIHSYEQRDGVGYSEIYCYIPNSAAESYYQINMPNKNIITWTHLPNEKQMIEGRVPEDEDILGTLDLHLSGATKYYYTQNFDAEFTKPLASSSTSETDSDEAIIRYEAYPVGTDMFKFNTIVVLYNIMVRDADANITVAYKDVPMAMFLTGLINQDGTVSNEVQKYSNCDDAYGSGTSYGLRICTRYMITPNSTTILTSEADVADQYAGFSRAMDKMAESQDMMNTLITDVVNNSQDLKDHLAMFKNYRVNIPYVIKVVEGNEKVPYWFVNGKSTGIRVSEPGRDGKDGSTPQLAKVNGVYHWFIDGVDTGIVAEGTKGKNGLDGPYWFYGTELTHERTDLPGQHIFSHDHVPQKDGDFYLNTDTGYVYVLKSFIGASASQWLRSFCLKGPKGENGTTPAARNNPDDNGNLWWYIGNTAICRAQGIDGTSMLCKDAIISSESHVGFPSDSCKPGDVVLYVGANNSFAKLYDVYLVKDTKFTAVISNNRIECYDAQLQGNIQGKAITGLRSIEGKKAIVVILSLADGTEFVIRCKRNHTGAPRFSSLQRSYACWDDVVYYRPGDEMWVEIPYNFVIDGVSSGTTTFHIKPCDEFDDPAATYRYIFKMKGDPDHVVSKGYRTWTSEMRFTVSSPRFSNMKATFGKFCRLGKLHLFVKYSNKHAGLLHAVYDYKHKNELRWELDPQDHPITVQRHGLTFTTPNSWSTTCGGCLDSDTSQSKSIFAKFHKLVTTGQHANAIEELRKLGTPDRTEKQPLYVLDPAGERKQKVFAKIWVKMPRRGTSAHQVQGGSGNEYQTMGGGYFWRTDKVVHNTEKGTTYRLDWSSPDRLIKALSKSAFGGNKAIFFDMNDKLIKDPTVRIVDNRGNILREATPLQEDPQIVVGYRKHKMNRRPYLYIAIFDKVGATGYLYKLTIGNETRFREDIIAQDAKIKYVGRIPYPKKTR